ncbi:MAG: hypothetical protein QM621_10720 [Aeromicrobium sp.]|uniref:hypothetical protein n=1 Tax=Aeromicrobium sp. TaxID=1871063 RepID=UPI0039E28601
MPSPEHEAAIELMRLAPQLATDLLGRLFGVDVSACASATAFAETSRTMTPRTVHADAAFVYHDADGEPVLSVVFEAQRSWDDDKRQTWRLYLAHLQYETRVPAALIVYCPDPRVAARYRSTLEDDGISSLLRPLIVTPDDLPLVVDPDAAARDPEFTVLAALAHHRDSQLLQAFPAIDAALASLVGRLGTDRAIAYHDVINAVMPEPTSTAWRDYMSTTAIPRVWLSDEFQELHEKGYLKGVAEAVLKVLDVRGVAVPEAIREQIISTTDLDRLNRWIEVAGTATSLDDLGL